MLFSLSQKPNWNLDYILKDSRKFVSIFKNPMGENNILQDSVTVFICIAELGDLDQIFFCSVLTIPRGTLLANLMILSLNKKWF